MDTLQLINGELGPVKEICLDHAEKTYNKRKKIDTNPVIVQMIYCGKLIDHWYYRSDQWIDQPYFKESIFLQPYVGPVSETNQGIYKNGKYFIDKELTEIVAKRNI